MSINTVVECDGSVVEHHLAISVDGTVYYSEGDHNCPNTVVVAVAGCHPDTDGECTCYVAGSHTFDNNCL